MQKFSKIFSYRSSTLLIIANLIPIIGILFLNWEFDEIIFLYWLENGVVGIFTIFKVLFVQKEGTRSTEVVGIAFFIQNYAAFMLGHAFFLFLFRTVLTGNTMITIGDLHEVWNKVYFGLIGLFISHGYSFFANYLHSGEYNRATIKQLLFQPYPRLMRMHAAVVVGAFPTLLLQNPLPLLVVLVILKTVFDLNAHVTEREKFQYG